MSNDVFANGREISCKKADGKSICAFPDVCFTPPQTPATPPGVPIPYPNTAFAKDTTKGSKNVKISQVGWAKCRPMCLWLVWDSHGILPTINGGEDMGNGGQRFAFTHPTWLRLPGQAELGTQA